MVDTHCHLDACDPPDAELVARAVAAGVERLATVGTDPDSVGRALAAAEAHPEVVAIVGRHPHASEGFGDAELEPLERAARHPARGRSARRASTTTATTPRAPTSGAPSRRSSGWPGGSGCR